MSKSAAFEESLMDYAFPQGEDVVSRYQPLHDWLNSRRSEGVWPFSRVALSRPGYSAVVANEFGEETREYLNFGSQDYLGLAQRSEVADAAKVAIEGFGVHSAGSPIVTGRTKLALELENRIATVLRQESATVFATGWAAGFGVLQGLVRFYDTIVMDSRSHSCLVEGARHAAKRVREFRHNDLGDLETQLREDRKLRSSGAIFIVIESLYSMDSDSPDLPRVLELARQYNATIIIDVAHDFGCMGERGLGLLETISLPDERVVVMGSFSKTFASNGGFVASTRLVKDQLTVFSSPFTFSNAISPIQTAIVLKCFEITFSTEGCELRVRLMENINLLRAAMKKSGVVVQGEASPIVPVFVGDEAVARMTARYLLANGLLANLAEYPGVPKGEARFRFQVMSTHAPEAITNAAEIMKSSRRSAIEALKNIMPNGTEPFFVESRC